MRPAKLASSVTGWRKTPATLTGCGGSCGGAAGPHAASRRLAAAPKAAARRGAIMGMGRLDAGGPGPAEGAGV
jgi:hypothetical protein